MGLGESLRKLGEVFGHKTPEASVPTLHILQSGGPKDVGDGFMLRATQFNAHNAPSICNIGSWKFGTPPEQARIDRDLGVGSTFQSGGRTVTVVAFGSQSNGNQGAVNVPHVEVSVLPPSKK